MKKIKIQICLGTVCFVMGSNTLQAMIETLANKYKDKIEVSGVRCLGMCSEQNAFSEAPFVKVDDELIAEATLEKVIAVIDRKLTNV